MLAFPVAAASRRLGAQTPTQAAQLLGGARATRQARAGLPQGMANLGIVRFEALATPPVALWRRWFAAQSLPAAAGPRFLRKSFCGDREARILAALYEAHQAHPAPGPPGPVPRILGLTLGPRRSSVFMEEISGIRGLPFRSLRDAAALARQIVALQRHLERASAGHDLGSAPGALLLRLGVLRKMIVRGGHLSLTKETLMPRLRRLRDAVAPLPLQLSHNDIHPANMAVQHLEAGGSELLQVRFIDFGMVGPNALGADLFHFAISSLQSPWHERFFNQLTLVYANQRRQPLAAVRLGAYAYAIQRLQQRWWRHQSMRRSPKRARRFLVPVSELLERAERQLPLLGQAPATPRRRASQGRVMPPSTCQIP